MALDSDPRCEPALEADAGVAPGEAAKPRVDVPTLGRGKTGGWTRHLERLVVAAASGAFGLSFGLNYGVDNQVVYNLGAVHLLNPQLFHEDWFVTRTTSYHQTFEYFSAALLWLDGDGWAFGILTTLLITLVGILMYVLCKLLAPKLGFPAFLLLCALAFATRLRGVGSSYIADYILQPSTLGSVGFVGAMLAFVAKRWGWSGILLGLGGLFHANYLILGGLVFGLSQLMLGREGLVRRGLLQLTAPSIALLLFVPTILQTTGGGDVQTAREILFHVRSPWHFSPVSYEVNFLPFVGWHLIGLGAGASLLAQDHGRRVAVLIGALVFVIWSGTAAATFFSSSVAAQLFVQRLAPHLELMLQALWAVATVRVIASPRKLWQYPREALSLVLAGLGCVLLFSATHGSRGTARLLLVALALVALSQFAYWLVSRRGNATSENRRRSLIWQRAAPSVLVVTAGAIIAGSAVSDLGKLRARSTLLSGLGAEQDQLYAWLKQNTEEDAILLSPPEMEGVRFHAQRAIVVDWKAVPIVPSEIIEWHRRLEDVTGRPVLSQQDLAGYDEMNDARLEMLKSRYAVSYVVTTSGNQNPLRGDVVFRNAGYTVLKL